MPPAAPRLLLRRQLGSDTPRLPPSKNLSHVPCKFFRQGLCQAGTSCPFSHDADALLDQLPCKYFQKGNCKFGSKCALAHLLPDGRRVNPRPSHRQRRHRSTPSVSASGVSTPSVSAPSVSAPSDPPTPTAKSPTPTAPVVMPSPAELLLRRPSLRRSPYTLPLLPNTALPLQPSSYTPGGIWATTTANTLPQQRRLSQRLPSWLVFDPRPAGGALLVPGSAPLVLASVPLVLASAPLVLGSTPLVLPSGGSFLLGAGWNGAPELAILDDDDDASMLDRSPVWDEEDCVPLLLSDLLTPQELQRRGLRSNSGVVRRGVFKIPATPADEGLQFYMEEHVAWPGH